MGWWKLALFVPALSFALSACVGSAVAPDETGPAAAQCAGEVDICGVCDGPGIPAGDCDCNGNSTFDFCGVCGGDCDHPLTGRYAARTVGFGAQFSAGEPLISKAIQISLVEIDRTGVATERFCFVETAQQPPDGGLADSFTPPDQAARDIPVGVATLRAVDANGDRVAEGWTRTQDDDRATIGWSTADQPAGCVTPGDVIHYGNKRCRCGDPNASLPEPTSLEQRTSGIFDCRVLATMEVLANTDCSTLDESDCREDAACLWGTNTCITSASCLAPTEACTEDSDCCSGSCGYQTPRQCDAKLSIEAGAKLYATLKGRPRLPDPDAAELVYEMANAKAVGWTLPAAPDPDGRIVGQVVGGIEQQVLRLRAFGDDFTDEAPVFNSVCEGGAVEFVPIGPEVTCDDVMAYRTQDCTALAQGPCTEQAGCDWDLAAEECTHNGDLDSYGMFAADADAAPPTYPVAPGEACAMPTCPDGVTPVSDDALAGTYFCPDDPSECFAACRPNDACGTPCAACTGDPTAVCPAPSECNGQCAPSDSCGAPCPCNGSSDCAG